MHNFGRPAFPLVLVQHVPSEKPAEDPTTAPTPSRVMVWYGIVAL